MLFLNKRGKAPIALGTFASASVLSIRVDRMPAVRATNAKTAE